MKLYVIVKKWFDKINGNTYHSVQFEIENRTYHSGKTYGYGTHYEQTTKEMLNIAKAHNTVKFDCKYIVIENCKKSELNGPMELK